MRRIVALAAALAGGAGAYLLTSSGSLDSFVWKLDSVGNFVGTFGWGTSKIDFVYGLKVDAQGNIYGAEVGPRTLKRYVKK